MKSSPYNELNIMLPTKYFYTNFAERETIILDKRFLLISLVLNTGGQKSFLRLDAIWKSKQHHTVSIIITVSL